VIVPKRVALFGKSRNAVPVHMVRVVISEILNADKEDFRSESRVRLVNYLQILKGSKVFQIDAILRDVGHAEDGIKIVDEQIEKIVCSDLGSR